MTKTSKEKAAKPTSKPPSLLLKQMASDVVPACDVATPGQGQALAKGSYGEIFMGSIGGFAVAMKVIKMYFKSKRGSPTVPASNPLHEEGVTGDRDLMKWDVAAREVLFVRSLESGSVIKLWSVDMDEKKPLLRLYMPFHNQPLATHNCASIMPLAKNLLRAVNDFHSQYIVHGDIKRENMLLEDDRVVLIDCSISMRLHGARLRRAVFHNSQEDLKLLRDHRSLETAWLTHGTLSSNQKRHGFLTCHKRRAPKILNTAYYDCHANLCGYPFGTEIDTWAVGIVLLEELAMSLSPTLLHTARSKSKLCVFWKDMHVKHGGSNNELWFLDPFCPALSDREFLKQLVAYPTVLDEVSDREVTLLCDLLKRGQREQMNTSQLLQKYWGEEKRMEVFQETTRNPVDGMWDILPFETVNVMKPEPPSPSTVRLRYHAKTRTKVQLRECEGEEESSPKARGVKRGQHDDDTVLTPHKRQRVRPLSSGLAVMVQGKELDAACLAEAKELVHCLARQLYRYNIVSLEAIITCVAWYKCLAPCVLHFPSRHLPLMHLQKAVAHLYASYYSGPRRGHARDAARFREFDDTRKSPHSGTDDDGVMKTCVLRAVLSNLTECCVADKAASTDGQEWDCPPLWLLPSALEEDPAATRVDEARRHRLWLALFLLCFHSDVPPPNELAAAVTDMVAGSKGYLLQACAGFMKELCDDDEGISSSVKAFLTRTVEDSATWAEFTALKVPHYVSDQTSTSMSSLLVSHEDLATNKYIRATFGKV